MKNKARKLLAFLLITIMLFQFSGEVGVNALESVANSVESISDTISDTLSKSTVSDNSETESSVKNKKTTTSGNESFSDTSSKINSDSENKKSKEPEVSTWKPEIDIKKGDLSLNQLKTAVLDESDIPEVLNVNELKSNDSVKRLREQEKSLDSIIYQNRDGTKTLFSFNQPVKYTDKDGNIKDISNKVIDSSDGYAFENEANNIKTLFPNDLNEKGVSLRSEKINIEFYPKKDSDKSEKFDISENKNKTEKEEKKVKYNSVFGKGTSLQYAPMASGIKEDIILESYTGQNKFNFTLKTNGLQLVNKDGQYILVDPLTGETAVNIGEIIVTDSSDKGLDLSIKYKHYMEYETVVKDQEYNITIVVDEEYLKDPTTVYPVDVDPTFKVEYPHNNSTPWIDDASIYADSDYTYGKNYGSSYWCWLGKYTEGTTYMGIGRFLMDFPGLYSNSLFNSLSVDQITNAELKIYQASRSAGNTNLSVYRYTGTKWNESTVTCNSDTYFNYDSSLIDWKYVQGNTVGYLNFNLTSAVKYWRTCEPCDQKGILIKSDCENDPSAPKCLISVEHPDYITELSVKYVDYYPVSVQTGIYNIYNSQSGYYLDAAGANADNIKNGTSLQVYPLHGGPNQQWYVQNQGDGYYKIMSNINWNYNLDVADQIDANLRSVRLWGSNDSNAQRWKIYANGDGTCYIMPKCSATRVLDVGSNNCLQLYDYNNGNNQKWRFDFCGASQVCLNTSSIELTQGSSYTLSGHVLPSIASQSITWSSENTDVATVSNGTVTAIGTGVVRICATSTADVSIKSYCSVTVWGQAVTDLQNGVYFLKNMISNNKYLATEGGTAASYIKAQVGDFNGELNQQWYFEKQSDGTYKILSNQNRAYSLDVDGSHPETTDSNTTKIQLWEDNGSNNQRWKIYKNSDKTYYIMPACSQTRVLDVDASTNNVQLWQFHDDTNQKWDLLNYNNFVSQHNGVIFNAINSLYNYAKSFAPQDGRHLQSKYVLQFIRRNVYNNVAWNATAGTVSQDFINYVNERDSSLLQIFNNRGSNGEFVYDYSGNKVDFYHLSATLNALLHQGTGSISDLAGWAGDLQSLAGEVISYMNSHGIEMNSTNMYNYTYSFMGDNTHKFGYTDLISDIDAVNIYALYNNTVCSGLNGYFEYYYHPNYNYAQRFSLFIGSSKKDNIINSAMGYLVGNLPLANGIVLTGDLRYAVSQAYANYLWGCYENEIE